MNAYHFSLTIQTQDSIFRLFANSEKKHTEYCNIIEDEFNSAGDEVIREYKMEKTNQTDLLFEEMICISLSQAMMIPEDKQKSAAWGSGFSKKAQP